MYSGNPDTATVNKYLLAENANLRSFKNVTRPDWYGKVKMKNTMSSMRENGNRSYK